MARHRGTFKPEHPEPYEVSRSQIQSFLNCPACFWMNRVKGIKFPGMPGFLLNTATDTLLKKDFGKYSRALANAELKTQGFEETLLKAKKDDFIFIDPPYLKNENNYESFRKYGKDIFSKEDLGSLAEILRSLSSDCKILISNFDLENVKTLFPDWNQTAIKQMSYISGAGKGRKSMEEVLIYNY